MAARSHPPRVASNPGGAFLPYIVLDFSPAGTPITSREAALALLRPLAAAAAVPGQGIEAELQRTLLRALLKWGLVENGSSFGLKAVAKQQAGQAILDELASARTDVAAAYRSPGLGLADLLDELQAAGVLALGTLPGKQAFSYSARPHWLQPYARRGAPPAPATRLVPLPSRPAPPPPATQPAVRQHAAGGSVQITLQPPAASSKPRVSRANAIYLFKNKLTRGLQGTSPADQLLQLMVACLLAEGLEKVDTLTFCQHPVTLKAARKAIEQQLHSKGPALQACYRSQFGGSLLALLQSPQLAGLVRLQGVPAPTEEGWQQAGGSEQGQVQLLLRPSAAGSGPVAAAAPGPAIPSSAAGQAAAAPADAAAEDGLQGWSFEPDDGDLEGWSFYVAEQAMPAGPAAVAQAPALSAAPPPPPVPLPLPQLVAAPVAATPAVPAAAGAAGAPGQVAVRAVDSEQAAGAAVAALLAAPGSRIGMACELGTSSDPSALVVSLFAPAEVAFSGSTCYVFDLAVMPPPDRKAALRLMGAVLENQQLIKVLHDGRGAAQALFNLPGRGIELRGICDTQVAHGLAQFLSLLGSEEAADGVDEPAPLPHLLALHQVPPPSLGGGA